MLKNKVSWIIVAMLAVMALVASVHDWDITMSSGRPQYPKGNLTIERADGTKFNYNIEIALGEKDQAYGLMYVKTMAEDAGMVFPYEPAREVAFWMKNTYIPLDMIFVREDHTIGHIATNARPLDETPVPSGVPTIAVIELNAGQVEKNGFAVGDKVDYANLYQK